MARVADPLLLNQPYAMRHESGEEQWIDDNSSQLIINRYNGTLTQAN